MASKVYFIPAHCIDSASAAARRLLEHIVESENIAIQDFVPLKLHFGEKGNTTFLPCSTYDGVKAFLDEKNISSAYYETSVLYGGERFKAEKHIALARKHALSVGLCGVIEGTLPIGGLSSSAAVIIAFLSALCKVNRITLSENELILAALVINNGEHSQFTLVWLQFQL
jgi:mevalonate kinase